ncbi:hypothetical protein A4D02_27215 [Niastella koreensis]|nr:hypothetical protein [Niastella koreensis]OQP50127.1 hypothetical protein A4D02_27215 [Niastella koreensis]
MKLALPLIIFTIAFFLPSCTFNCADNFEFGIKYNPVRRKFGSPLIKHYMSAHNCCGAWTTYEIDNVPADNGAYHSSKTIRVITNGKVTNEEDLYRKQLNDTTILQLDIETALLWENDSLEIYAKFGKIDTRKLKIEPKDVIIDDSKYPRYEKMKLDRQQIDSVLRLWNLSRFEKE